MRTVAALAAVLGGLSWVGAAWVDVLAWVGTALVAVAVLGAGAGLVSRGATWLRWIVSVCFLALVASVLSVLLDGLDDQAVLLAAGAGAALAGGLALTRRTPSRGSHAR